MLRPAYLSQELDRPLPIARRRTATPRRARLRWRPLRRAGEGSGAFLTLVKRAKIDGLCAAVPRGADLVCDGVVRHQYLHAGAFDVVDMHKNIGAAAVGRDETKSAICIEEFDPPSWHAINTIQRTLRAPTRRRDVPGLGITRCSRPGRPLSAPSCQYEFYLKTAYCRGAKRRSRSLDHLVVKCEQRVRYVKPHCLCGFQIEHEQTAATGSPEPVAMTVGMPDDLAMSAAG